MHTNRYYFWNILSDLNFLPTRTIIRFRNKGKSEVARSQNCNSNSFFSEQYDWYVWCIVTMEQYCLLNYCRSFFGNGNFHFLYKGSIICLVDSSLLRDRYKASASNRGYYLSSRRKCLGLLQHRTASMFPLPRLPFRF